MSWTKSVSVQILSCTEGSGSGEQCGYKEIRKAVEIIESFLRMRFPYGYSGGVKRRRDSSRKAALEEL
ncbi:unnamed protein product [Bathycoccus prasinos]